MQTLESIQKENEKNITVVKNMRDYSNDPLVVQKREEAKTFLKKNPIPPSLLKNKQK